MSASNTHGTCLACDSSMKHCQSCSSMNKCFMCDNNIAKKDAYSKCTRCNTETGWTKTSDGNCECPKDKYVTSDHKCQACSEIIRGCITCSAVEDVNVVTDLHVSLGQT